MDILKKQKTEKSHLWDQIIVLMVLCFMSWYFYGIRAVIVAGIAVISCFLAEFIFIVLSGRKMHTEDTLNSVVTGLIFAMMLPASVPYYVIVVGSIVAGVVARQVFGGRGHTIFSPAAVAFAFSSICWPSQVLMYPKPTEALAFITVSNTLYPSITNNLLATMSPNAQDIEVILGEFCGGMGTTHWIVLSVIVIMLIIRRTISPLTFLLEEWELYLPLHTYFHNYLMFR